MSKPLDAETQKSFTYLKEVEEVAQEILTDKQTKLELANAQNKCREAYRALQGVEDRQTWLKIGAVHVRLPKEECREILKNGLFVKTCWKWICEFLPFLEIDIAEDDLKVLQGKLRENLGKLRDLEHEPRLEGMGLKPMSVAEARTLNKAFGSV